MDINYLAVGACAVLAMAVGSVWYGRLFGSTWMRLIGLGGLSAEERLQMQKSAGPLYALQLAFSLIQISVLAHFLQGRPEAEGVETALWIWLGFVLPTIAQLTMWNGRSAKDRAGLFLLSVGYNLVLFVLFGLILSVWQ